MCPSPLSMLTSVLNSAFSTRRNAHCAVCVQNCRNFSQPTQSRAHFGFASDVNATDRPNPYCQCASTGSPLSEINGISARVFGVVQTYPRNVGYSFAAMPRMISLGPATFGLNGSSKIADFKITAASLMKICGSCAGLFTL